MNEVGNGWLSWLTNCRENGGSDETHFDISVVDLGMEDIVYALGISG